MVPVKVTVCAAATTANAQKLACCVTGYDRPERVQSQTLAASLSPDSKRERNTRTTQGEAK